jgi:hypothetical protein
MTCEHCESNNCKRYECDCCSISCYTNGKKLKYRTWNNKKNSFKISYCSDCKDEDWRFKDVECEICKEVLRCEKKIISCRFDGLKEKDIKYEIVCSPCVKIKELEDLVKALQKENLELINELNEK